MEIAEQPCFEPPKKYVSRKKSGSVSHDDQIISIQGVDKSPSDDSSQSPSLEVDVSCKGGNSVLENGDISCKRDYKMIGVHDKNDKISVSPIIENGHIEVL